MAWSQTTLPLNAHDIHCWIHTCIDSCGLLLLLLLLLLLQLLLLL
jgi:hypothetical protein